MGGIDQMKKTKVWIGFLLLACIGVFSVSAAQTGLQSKAQDILNKTPETQTVIQGQDGFLFLKSELNHVTKGPLVSALSSPSEASVAILDFNQQLKQAGIRLIVIPVPAKLEVYPDKLFGDGIKVEKNPQAEFYRQLEEKGVQVLDLFPLFIQETSGNIVYCRQDSHWNAQGMNVAVKALAQDIQKEKWYKAQRPFKVSPVILAVQGDLSRDLNQPEMHQESLMISKVEGKTVDESSPILVMGDSHTLIFHSGDDMLAENAGFVDQLAAALSIPVDLIGVRGSGATPVRINLYRKASKQPDWLKNKKIIIWCFTAREFTQSQNGWKKIPLFKQ